MPYIYIYIQEWNMHRRLDNGAKYKYVAKKQMVMTLTSWKYGALCYFWAVWFDDKM